MRTALWLFFWDLRNSTIKKVLLNKAMKEFTILTRDLNEILKKNLGLVFLTLMLCVFPRNLWWYLHEIRSSIREHYVQCLPYSFFMTVWNVSSWNANFIVYKEYSVLYFYFVKFCNNNWIWTQIKSNPMD